MQSASQLRACTATVQCSHACHLKGKWLRAGTLTKNEMTVVRMWLAGQLHSDPVWLPMSTATNMREGETPTNPLRLEAGLAQTLCQSVALNTTANLRINQETSEPGQASST